jgi:hypothetical protein
MASQITKTGTELSEVAGGKDCPSVGRLDIISAAERRQATPISIWDVTTLTRLLKMSKVAESKISFDAHATASDEITRLVTEFLAKAETLETELGLPILVFEDGVNQAYNVRVSIRASIAAPLCDLNAKLDASKPESLRANRELLKKHLTYLNMVSDAKKGREFSDIIVQYDTDYAPDKPLKVWGGQHRISAITEAVSQANRYHGFRIYFNLSKKQKSDLALVSNTNMNVSRDTFDRIIEETQFENKLRDWARTVGLLGPKDDFPDSAGKAGDKITVKRGRCIVVNFYRGKELGRTLTADQLDHRVYEPPMIKSGAVLDPKYKDVMETNDILTDKALIEAGKAFAGLHRAQITAFEKSPELKKEKANRTKALVESVLCGWSFIAGLLQAHPERLANHYQIPKTDSKKDILDPLNAKEMSNYKHEWDDETYRGLGTRAEMKDRQRIAQLFLVRSAKHNAVIDYDLMDEAVTQVLYLAKKRKRKAAQKHSKR